MGYWGYGFDYGFFHILSSVFWIVLIVLLISALRRRRWGPPWWASHYDGHGPWHDRSIEILKERYAKGEIGKEEFEAKKKDLEAGR
jgi:Predicted membrane protein